MATTRARASEGERSDPGVAIESATELCRYRRELAGSTVCWAASRLAIVTDGDCDRCPVPSTLEQIDCYYLQATIELGRPLQVRWICGATGLPVNDGEPSDCSACELCERARSRRPTID